MYANELRNLLKPYKDSVHRKFLNVYPCDKLPLKTGKSFCLILNNMPHTHQGQHWQVLSSPDGINCEFFCSLGEKPGEEVIKYIQRKGYKQIFFNKCTIQKKFQRTCGLYALFCISKFAEGHSFESIVNTFDRVKDDDNFVRSYVLRKFNYSLAS